MTDREMAGISFRCTKEEMTRINRAAATAGRSRSELVRDAVLNRITGSGRARAGFDLVLPAELQEHFVQGIVLANLLTQKRMIDSGDEELFRQASARATEIVRAMLPDGWSDSDGERNVAAGD